MKDDEPPEVPEALITKGKCSACRRVIPTNNDIRCPYVSCRKWFRSKADLFAPRTKKKEHS